MTAYGRSVPETVDEVNALAESLIDQVAKLVSTRTMSRADVEATVLRGLTASTAAVQDLSHLVDRAQQAREDATPIIEALAEVEQKLDFFRACTMRRSSAMAAAREKEIEAYAAEAEQIAEGARATGHIDRLVEAYKALERLEAQVVELRGAGKTGEGPQPRVLDLPRARILVARRGIGATLRELDSE